MEASKCLSGSIVACTGLDEKQKTEVIRLAVELGAQVVNVIHLHDLPHVLIANSVRTEKYKVGSS